MGVDIIEVERVRSACQRTPSLPGRLFTPAELAYAESSERHRWARLAARFAAKEALLKALGSGLRQVKWAQIEVVRDDLGRPDLVLTGAAAELARRLGVTRLHLSLSHTENYAVANVLALGGELCTL